MQESSSYSVGASPVNGKISRRIQNVYIARNGSATLLQDAIRRRDDEDDGPELYIPAITAQRTAIVPTNVDGIRQLPITARGVFFTGSVLITLYLAAALFVAEKLPVEAADALCLGLSYSDVW